jgi:hypothetical protein
VIWNMISWFHILALPVTREVTCQSHLEISFLLLTEHINNTSQVGSD